MATNDSKSLKDLTKEQVADLAAMLFNYQLLGPSVILGLAESFPWLVERAPRPDEMEGILNLARRGKNITEEDEEYRRVVKRAKQTTPYRKPAPEPPKVPSRFAKMLREANDALEKIAACRCRRELVKEGPHTYEVTISDDCPVCGKTP